MALSDNALITVATARANISGLPSTDADVEILINEASDIADTYARRTLAAADYIDEIDGHGGRWLILPHYPIQSITDIRIDSGQTWDSTSVVLASSYRANNGSGMIFRRTGWREGYQNIRVDYRAGYELGSVPQDLVSAVVATMAWKQRRKTGNQIGATSHQYGDEQITFEQTPPTEAQRVFESYKDMRYV